eukprot:3074690-Pyramimonas_sp.AAC.1
MRAGVYDVSQSLPAGFHHSVRVLGGWVDTDGGSRTDASRRIQAASRVWVKLRCRLGASKLPLKTQGQIFQAPVIGRLLYGAEVRAFHQKDIGRYQAFVGRCIRYLACRARGTTLRSME